MMTLKAGQTAVGAVMDLRAYAEGTAPSAAWLDGRAAPAFADDKAVVCAFALRGTGQVAFLPSDEFVLVLKGGLEIAAEGTAALVLGPDDCCALPYGCSFGWTASDDLLALVYSAPTDRAGNVTVPVMIDKSAPLNPSTPPARENLLGDVPTCRGFSDYVSANAEFCAGTWDSTPYHRRQIPYRQVELMLLMEGAVTFSDGNGSVSFGKGDVCLFVRGDGCAWLSEEYVKKVFATQRPLS